jgi:hypothetical protein
MPEKDCWGGIMYIQCTHPATLDLGRVRLGSEIKVGPRINVVPVGRHPSPRHSLATPLTFGFLLSFVLLLPSLPKTGTTEPRDGKHHDGPSHLEFWW